MRPEKKQMPCFPIQSHYSSSVTLFVDIKITTLCCSLMKIVLLFFPGLLSEEQCRARDVRRKQKSTKIKKSDTNSPETPPGQIERSDSEDCKEKIKSKLNIKAETIIDDEPLNKVGEGTKKLVEKVVFLQDKYEFPDENVSKNINVSMIHCAKKR